MSTMKGESNIIFRDSIRLKLDSIRDPWSKKKILSLSIRSPSFMYAIIEDRSLTVKFDH